MTKQYSELFVCRCGEMDHNIIFQTTDFGNNAELSVHITLNPNNKFVRRVWSAIKYVFNIGIPYYHYDEILINYSDLPRLQTVLDNFKVKYYKNRDKKTKYWQYM